MFKDDLELDEILIGTDLESSPDLELDMLPKLVGTDESHESDIILLDINIHVLCVPFTTIVQRLINKLSFKKFVARLFLLFFMRNIITRNIFNMKIS